MKYKCGNEVQVGDVVRCVNASQDLVRGNEYTITAFEDFVVENFVMVAESKIWYWLSRFEFVRRKDEEPQPATLREIRELLTGSMRSATIDQDGKCYLSKRDSITTEFRFNTEAELVAKLRELAKPAEPLVAVMLPLSFVKSESTRCSAYHNACKSALAEYEKKGK